MTGVDANAHKGASPLSSVCKEKGEGPPFPFITCLVRRPQENDVTSSMCRAIAQHNNWATCLSSSSPPLLRRRSFPLVTAELIWQQPPGGEAAISLLAVEKYWENSANSFHCDTSHATTSKKKKKLHLKAPEEPGLHKQKIPNQRQHLYCSGCGFQQTDSLDTAL